jgi:hypothetical protein
MSGSTTAGVWNNSFPANANVPLKLHWDNGAGGNLTGGNASNTLTVIAYYSEAVL